MSNPPPNEDLDLLADFVIEAVKTGKADIVKGMKLSGALKRQGGKLDAAVGHIVRRYCREDETVSALLEGACAQSPMAAKLADRLGLRVKDATPG